jgi:ATP-dependent helicase/nuclease subunit A
MGNLFIYQSSAGSGKTYKLAKEYIKLAFKYPGAFKNILAITFTNKATEEMKNRVLKFLADLSIEKDNDLKSQLINEGVKGDIKELARLTLRNILHNYSDFSISTIDSFFNKVLRSFSKELRMQIGYEIEMDQDEVLKNITGMLLKDLSRDIELRKYLEDFILLKISEDRGWDIEKDIMTLGKEIFKERYWEKKFVIEGSGSNREISDSREKIRVLMHDVQKIINDFEIELRKIGDDAESSIIKSGLGIEDFAYSETGVMGFLLHKIRNKKEFDLEKSKRAFNVYSKNTGWYSKSSPKKIIIQEIVDDKLYSLLKSAVEYIQSGLVKYYSAKELKNILFTLGIFEDLISKLNEYRKSGRKILQSDVNNILQGLISDDNSPFIYEKIGSNFKNLLVDEFQDTSTFQWKNLLPVITNVLSEGNSVLVAGDVKQSVYRWRSGNMKLLLSQIYEDLAGYRELLKTEFLKTNRRSSREIVQFNNDFFLKAVEEISKDIDDENYKKLLLKAYNRESVEQKYIKQGGYVNIRFFNNDDNEGSAKSVAEETIPGIIKESLNDGYRLSDILILVRKNSEVRKVSELLTTKSIDIVSAESLLVNNSPKVRLIVDMMKYIVDNKNELVKIDALYNYIEFIINNKTGYKNIFENPEEKFVSDIPEGFFKENESPKIKPILNDLTVYEVCENLIQIFGFSNNSDPYIIKFQDAILKYSEKENSDLVSFLNWWRENKYDFSIDSSGNTNAVKVMTIHKAKGLQGKVVIVPYANWKIDIDGNKDLIWVSSDEEPFDKSASFPVKAVKILNKTYFRNDYNYEFAQTRLDNLNLLYVTFTRAEERLYILVPEISNSKNTGKLIKNIIEGYEGFRENDFEAGKKEKAPEDKNDFDIETENMKYYISTEWYKKMIVKPKHIKLKEFSDKDFSFKTNWGTIVHNVLSHMKTKEDMDFAVNKAQSEGIINQQQKEKITELLLKILNHNVVKDWFKTENVVKSESEILLNDGNILRPDRVILNGKEAIIIDYKTGLEKEEHKKQVKKYGEVLSLMGFTKISKYLLYLNFEGIEGIKILEVNR